MEAQLFAGNVTAPFLAGAQSPEVLGRARHDVGEELDLDGRPAAPRLVGRRTARLARELEPDARVGLLPPPRGERLLPPVAGRQSYLPEAPFMKRGSRPWEE